MNLKYLGVILVVASAACSSAVVRTMPNEDGSVRIVARDTEQHDAEEAAADAAQDYCKDRKKDLVVIKEKTKYTGQMDEGTRKAVRGASKAASMIGGMDSPVQDAGMVGQGVTADKDYESEIVFKCK